MESAGADNAGAAGGAAPTEALALIDDVEGEFPRLPQRDGRTGQWFAAHDDTYGSVSAASALELTPTRGASRFAAGISGSGYTDWGVQLGVALRTPYSSYDASQYCGVRFLARGTPGQWALLVSDRQTVPEGGTCVVGAWDTPTGCYAFVGQSFSVESEWREVVIAFRDLTFMADPASGRILDSSAIYDILFHFRSAAGSGFQLLVDDLSFIRGSSTGCQ